MGIEDQNFSHPLVQERTNVHGIRIALVFAGGILLEYVCEMKEVG